MKEELLKSLKRTLFALGVENTDVHLDTPADLSNGDYTSNIALLLSKQLGKSARELADEISAKLTIDNSKFRVEVAGPGFINFWVSKEQLMSLLVSINELQEKFGVSEKNKGKKIFIEYAHPNTHKEMHIGHMRTLITGESLARLFEATSAIVFRANYQGDIGPHVAKAIYGIQKIMQEEGLTLNEIEMWDNIKKAHFLGQGYIRGNKDYETNQEEIDDLNAKLYNRDHSILDLYQKTRRWNLEYYEDFYHSFYTKFDRLFFESEMDAKGLEIVRQNVGKIFIEDDGAVIFPGEKYRLHRRVFITKAGYPTYEGKEMANAYSEYEAFPFDLKVHVVASEQTGYFQVVFKALELLDAAKFKGKQHHVSMGMVQLADRKISSRTGDIITVDWLIGEVKKRVYEILTSAKISKETVPETIEQVTIGAVKYSVLKNGTNQNVTFDIEKSVALEGNSGPYLQYTYARTRSVLGKSGVDATGLKNLGIEFSSNIVLENEEINLLRSLIKFPEIVEDTAEKYAPSILAGYLFELAQSFNLFYQKHAILEAGGKKEFRLALTSAVGQVLKNGLNLLGIESPEKM